MKICQVNLDDRLGRYFEPLESALESSMRYFLIVHPQDVHKSVSRELVEWLEDPNCGGILYVKGKRRAGLSRAAAQTIEDHNNQRVHFLSYAVGDHDDIVGDLVIRFSRFFKEVETEDKIDWRLIDEPWPENLFAIYLLAKALSILDPDEVQTLMAQKGLWANMWEAARREYRLSTSRELAHEDLNAVNASQVASQVKCFLETLQCGIDSELTCVSKAIRHDWLVNDILFFSPDSVAKIYSGVSPARDRFDKRVKQWGTDEGSLRKTIALSSQIMDGLNPAQRVDEGPLRALQDEARALIRKAISGNYAGQSQIREISSAIQGAVSDLAERYSRFLADWDSQPPVEQARIKNGFEEIRLAARVLYDRLGQLPKGVLLT